MQLFRSLLKKIPPRWWIFLLVAVLAGTAWFILTRLPLGSDLDRIIMVSKTSSNLTLPAGSVVRQVFRTNGGQYSGIVVSSLSPRLDGRRFSVRILGKGDKELAKSYGLTTYYLPADNTLRLQFALTPFTVAPHEEITEEISLLSGPPLDIRATDLHSQVYREGRLHINGVARDKLIAVALLKPANLPFEEQMGIFAGLLFVVALAGIVLFVPARWQWLSAGGLFVLITPLALYGFWFSEDALGIADWDYYFSLHHYYRETILTYHQFPLWDPWTCGGTAALGDPEFPLFSVTFLLELLFGIPAGLRLAIYVSVAGTAMGMLALARRLHLSVWAGALAALSGAFGSVSLLEIVEGHVNVFAAMWIPWIFWAWLAAYQKRLKIQEKKSKWWDVFLETYVLWCAVFLALTFYAGGIYLLMYVCLAFLFLLVVVPYKRQALLVTAVAGSVALGLAAVKLVPVLLWLRQFPDQAYASSTVTLGYWYDILLGRYLHNSYVIFAQDSGWHEYGAYIGPFVFTLALLGLSQLRRRAVLLLACGGFMAGLLSMAGPALQPWFDMMWFFPRSNISRIILMAVLPLCLLSGFGLDTLRQKLRVPIWVVAVLVGLAAVDLLSLSSQLSRQSFVLPHMHPLISPAPAPLAISSLRYDDEGSGSRHTRTYDAAVAGYGSTVYCSVLGPAADPRLITDPGGDVYALAQDSRAQVTLLDWSPNGARVRVDSPVSTKIGINTTYVQGWYVNNKPAIEMDNRVAGVAAAGAHEYVFTYRTPGLPLGLVMSLVVGLAVALRGLFAVQLRYGKK